MSEETPVRLLQAVLALERLRQFVCDKLDEERRWRDENIADDGPIWRRAQLIGSIASLTDLKHEIDRELREETKPAENIVLSNPESRK